jgi:hypothetical protein
MQSPVGVLQEASGLNNELVRNAIQAMDNVDDQPKTPSSVDLTDAEREILDLGEEVVKNKNFRSQDQI